MQSAPSAAAPSPGIPHAGRQPAADAPPGATGLLDQVLALGQDVLGRAHDHLALAAVEARLAGRSLVIMIAAGVMIAVLLISAWVGLLAAGILWLADMGLSVSLALILAIGANLVLAALLYGLIARQSNHLRFPATLRSLRPLPARHEPTGTSSL